MNMLKLVGILLIIGGLALGYMGIQKVSKNDASVEILDLEIDVSNKSGKQQGYIYLGLAVLLFGGGIYTLTRKQ
ncbi:MAG: hypothetical protein IPH04_15970 [Saprospirales bacterium]|jgi:hypothetical protein|nr:hypothetical protein [Saprospirales bacterium]MBK6904246.1 hypothetical protein [Saprospirales bacterium]MBK7336619.1 hypothetical protein [Saprospirales bacterium]